MASLEPVEVSRVHPCCRYRRGRRTALRVWRSRQVPLRALVGTGPILEGNRWHPDRHAARQPGTLLATPVDLLQGTLDVLVLKALSWGPRHGHGVAPRHPRLDVRHARRHRRLPLCLLAPPRGDIEGAVGDVERAG